MKGCKSHQGLIAESVYQELADADRADLDRHLEGCEACRSELANLQALTAAIPADRATLDIDLGPSIQAKLKRGPLRSYPQGNRFVWAALGATAALALFFAWPFAPSTDNPGLTDEFQGEASPSMAAIGDSQDLIEQGNYTGAYQLLSMTFDQHSESPDSGEVLRHMADVAYVELKWYEKSYEAYLQFRNEHYGQFQSDEESIFRLNVLDEARGSSSDFDSLLALDQARVSSDFEAFEKVIVRYPATYVASLAAGEMAQVNQDLGADIPPASNLVQAMESAMKRCTNPIALAQVKLELGHLYRSDPDKSLEAKSLYEDVAATGPTVLAGLAQHSLTILGARPSVEER